MTAQDPAESRLASYTPGGGLNQIVSWMAAVFQMNQRWYAVSTIYYHRLMDDAANSPTVTQRGALIGSHTALGPHTPFADRILIRRWRPDAEPVH
ncbi:MipA/OmpV family protein [Paraburkholderia azotifigens]|uniref:MipA/OmpV family protein n=1 Tax=Paraburkholderia azotifigens TaxID=2057004 RepID=A0ABU9QZK3_9BURK